MHQETFYKDGKSFKRVTKRVARNYYNANKGKLLIAPCLLNMNCAWASSLTASTIGVDDLQIDFDKFVNIYEIYNCSFELGKRAKYFIQVE